MQKQGQCGAYRLFKLGKGVGNTFSHDYKKLERDLHIVNHDYADLINKNSVINGSLYEYDEKSSKLYWEKKPYREVKEFTEFEEVKSEDVESEIETLRAEYLLLSGKKANNLWREKKLTELIEELKK